MGYQKLIELLNECLEEKGKEYRFRRIVDNDFFEIGDDTGLGYETIFSKKYGFIERLVDNDKIDTYKLEKIGYEKTVFRYDGQYIEIVEYSDYESLLMLLSIQDNPIEFLCSVLK